MGCDAQLTFGGIVQGEYLDDHSLEWGMSRANGSLVNTHTHTHIHKQLMTGCTISSAS